MIPYPSIIKEQYNQELQQISVNNHLPGVNQLADWLITYCKPYFSQTNKMVFRGIIAHDPHNLVSVSPVRKDRKPYNTDPLIHDTADKAFEQLFGYKFRSGSIFVTGSENDASTYGMNHIVIPIGEFVYCWSPNVYDFYMTTLEDEMITPSTSVEDMKHFLTFMGYKTTDIEQAITSQNEIMIYCDSFVKIRVDSRRTLAHFENVFNIIQEKLNGKRS